jgi:uncharacterized protein (DUF4415 family)
MYIQIICTIQRIIRVEFEWDETKRRIDMKKKNTGRKSLTDFSKLDKMKDSEIDYSDIPDLGEKFWKNAILRMPKNKKSVSIRIDEDVLAWFKRQGKGYQTRINEILKTYMRAKTA